MTRLLILLAALVCAGSAEAQTKLEVSHFPGAVWAVWAGMDQGYFAKEKLDIHLDPVKGSVQQMTGMMDGTYDLGLTALDNIIATDAGEGEAQLKEQPDLFAFMGGEGLSMRLIGAPAIKRIRDLKGKILAVDAKSTGFAFVLYRALDKAGLKPGDYATLAAGSSGGRLEALTGGKAQAAGLNRPFDSMALAQGANDLGDIAKLFPHYQSSAGIARRSWAAAHREALVGFIRAYVKASLWLFEPRNKNAAIALLTKNTPNLPQKTAEDIYASTTGPKSVTSPAAKIDPAGVAAVVALREHYAQPKKNLDPKRFYDLSYYKAATR